MNLRSAERGLVKKCGMKWRIANPGTDGIEECLSQRGSAEKGCGKEC